MRLTIMYVRMFCNVSKNNEQIVPSPWYTMTFSVEVSKATPEKLLLPIPMINCFKRFHNTSLIIYSYHLLLTFNSIVFYILTFVLLSKMGKKQKRETENITDKQAANRNRI